MFHGYLESVPSNMKKVLQSSNAELIVSAFTLRRYQFEFTMFNFIRSFTIAVTLISAFLTHSFTLRYVSLTSPTGVIKFKQKIFLVTSVNIILRTIVHIPFS